VFSCAYRFFSDDVVRCRPREPAHLTLDWSRTRLGPVERWPEALRTSVSACLECAFPIVIWWGPELAILYNDEYRTVLGPAKHPAALGQPGGRV
jgi:hypothetical protein